MSTAPPVWVPALARLVRGTVATRADPLFQETISLFNAACHSAAHAVVLVLDADDVSAVVQFALAHSLSISVKSGGYNTAGWSLGGAIIIDLLALDSIIVHTPNAAGRVEVPSLGPKSAEVREEEGRRMEGLFLSRGRKRGEAEAFDGSQRRCSDEGLTGSPLSFDNLPPAPNARPDHASISAQNSRSSSQASSATGERFGSGGDRSEETGETSGEGSGSNQLSPALEASGASFKGKERALDERGRRSASSGTDARTASRDLTDAGTRSWVAEQARDDTHFARDSQEGEMGSGLPAALNRRPSGAPYQSPSYHLEDGSPSYATSFSDRPSPAAVGPSASHFPFPPSAPSQLPLALPYSTSASFPPYLPPNGVSLPDPSRGGFGGISSAGFTFNPATMAGGASAGPTSAGFVFNAGALTSTSKLASPPALSPTSLPRASASILPTLDATSLPSASGSGSSPASSSSSVPHALVTIGTGAKSKEIDRATSQFSYHVPLAAYPVGCAIFASGGFGFLSRLHGLSMDNVVEVEMVMPDGRIVYLHELGEEGSNESTEVQEKRELWWAYRGAGLALGIITRVRAKAYHTGLVYSGNLIYPFNPITTPSLMKHWRDCCKGAPRELYMNLILTAGPTPAQHVVVIQLCYVGPRSEGDQFLQNIMSWEGEVCLLKDVETRTFMTQQDSVVQILSAQAGNRWCIRADLMNSLPDECINKTVAAFKNIPERSAWLFEIAAGAIADVAPASSCFPASHRSAPFQVAAIHQWKSPSEDEKWTNAARRWITDVISPHSPGGSFPCFLEAREGLAKIRDTFGPTNWERLVGVKNRLDPSNLMSNTFWPSGEKGMCEL